MMKPSIFSLLTLPLTVVSTSIPFQLVKRNTRAQSRSFGIAASSNVGVSNAASSGQMIGVTDNQDTIYIANITIAGQSYSCQLDTGSSDLWVQVGHGASVNATSINANITYGIGYVAGPVALNEVDFAGFNIKPQAYIAGTDVNNPALSYGAQGVIGMGFTSLSTIDFQVNGTGASWGRSLLYNIFAQNPSEPNYIAYALQRNDDPNQDVQGVFSIGEVSNDYSSVLATPRIPTYPAHNPNRWTLVLDDVVANGKNISLNSVVSGMPSNKAVGLLDTGTSAIYASTDIVQAIYGGISGATFVSQDNQWQVPCDAEVDVSLVIGGRVYNMHPLDMVDKPAGSDSCIGSWQPGTFTVGAKEFDIILGDPALRSLYTVYDFGNFDGSMNMGDPYIQLWSLVEDGKAASQEFHQARGGSSTPNFIDNTGVNAAASGSASVSSSNGGSSSSGSSDNVDVNELQHKVDTIYKWAPALFALTGFNALLLILGIGGILYKMTSRRKRKTRPKSKAPTMPEAFEVDEPSGSFIPLARPKAPALGEYRPVSLGGETIRNSALYDSPKSPSDPKFFNRDSRYND